MFSNEILPKSAYRFYCNFCDYGTCKKSSYSDHILSAKHEKSMFGKQNSNENLPKSAAKYSCENCGKNYKDNSGLWRHKKKCNNSTIQNNDEKTDKDLIMMLIKQNSELMEVIKNGTTSNSHNNNSTNYSHNKTFNLQFFLNETCKDAMNIMDFVDSIKLQLSDLENVGKLGYVEGISNIIVKNLKELDVTERPVHCTDKKRETIYIKDEDKWEKEDVEKKKIRKVIKKVATKNALMLPKFKEKYPDCVKSISPFSDQYNKIIVESMGGTGDNDKEKEDKIIRNISKNIIIDK